MRDDPHQLVDLNALELPALWRHLVEPVLDRVLAIAFEEDLADVGDVTTSTLVDPALAADVRVRTRSDGVVAGLPLLAAIEATADGALVTRVLVEDGAHIVAGDVVAELSGSLAALLPRERTLLNLLGRLSGVATTTAAFVERVRGTNAVICDTRKTTPGLRALEKYAVRCGGGTLHRIGLHDAMLVKDNHLGAIVEGEFAEAIDAAARVARTRHALRFIEVEVDTLEQFDALLALDPGVIDIVLLDNMAPATLAEAVVRRDARAPALLLEASGGVRLETARAIAESGVDRISVGALTHSAVQLDFGLDLASRA